MALTQFPIEVTEPTVDVVLPVGTHVLELVVEDSAGLRSAPATVTVTVVEETAPAVPVIEKIEPAKGKPGDRLEAIITGENLEKATAVEFIRAGTVDGSFEVVIGASEPDRVVVNVSINESTEPGLRNFRVVTPAGTAQSPAGVFFTVEGEVAAEPVIEGIVPTHGQVGETVQAVIAGSGLSGVEEAAFFLESTRMPSGLGRSTFPGLPENLVLDENIVAEIKGCTDTEVGISVAISEKAEVGPRLYAVQVSGRIVAGPELFTVDAQGTFTPKDGVKNVPGMEAALADKLAEEGITDLGKLAGAEAASVADKLGITEAHAAEFIAGAKQLLGVPKVDLSGRSVQEVSGIGTVLAARLAENGITDLAEVAAMEASALSKLLETTEERAGGFIQEAQRLLG